MGLLDILKRRKTPAADDTSKNKKSLLPAPDTMFALNFSAMRIIKEGTFAEYGFESQLDLVAAFTIVEILGAAGGKMNDDEIVEVIAPQFDITPDRCQFLIGQARKANI